MTDQKKLCIVLYTLYAASAVMQISEQTLLPGLLLMVIAVSLNYSRRKATKGTPFESHLQWMLRTFWIGTGVIMPVMIFLAAALILAFTDIGSVTKNISADNPEALMAGIENYMRASSAKISAIIAITAVPTLVWWLHRCWRGYALLKDEKPVEKVMTWL